MSTQSRKQVTQAITEHGDAEIERLREHVEELSEALRNMTNSYYGKPNKRDYDAALSALAKLNQS